VTLEVLDSIPFEIDRTGLVRDLRIPDNSGYVDQLMQLVDAAESVAVLKAAYRIAPVQARTDKSVSIDGISFTSRVLSVNLSDANRVFAYVATCGIELEDWAATMHDMLESFWADYIKEQALHIATESLHQHIIDHFQPGEMSSMNPGSLADWPMSQQPLLFSLLGDVEGAVGVRLTSTRLMIPTKSVSGLLFPTEETFASCQLCPMPDCPNRRAPIDAELFDRKYR
jgi:hypothetical protein